MSAQLQTRPTNIYKRFLFLLATVILPLIPVALSRGAKLLISADFRPTPIHPLFASFQRENRRVQSAKTSIVPVTNNLLEIWNKSFVGETVTFIPVAIISTNSLFLVDVLFLWKPLPLAHSAFWLGHSLKKKSFSKEFRLCWGLNMCMKTILANQTYKKVSHTGNWTRVFWVKARYPNH